VQAPFVLRQQIRVLVSHGAQPPRVRVNLDIVLLDEPRQPATPKPQRERLSEEGDNHRDSLSAHPDKIGGESETRKGRNRWNFGQIA
jgi:hypothetical protein